MGVMITGFIELEQSNNDMMISDQKKKHILLKAGGFARDKVEQASPKRAINGGKLKSSWRMKYQRLDGNWSIRLYSVASHDIYNELGSSTNKEHIGFFSKTIDKNMDEVVDIMIKGMFDK